MMLRRYEQIGEEIEWFERLPFFAKMVVLGPTLLVLVLGTALQAVHGWIPGLSQGEIRAAMWILAILAYLVNRHNFRSDAFAKPSSLRQRREAAGGPSVLDPAASTATPWPSNSPTRASVLRLMARDPAFSALLIGERLVFLLTRVYAEQGGSRAMPDGLKPYLTGAAWMDGLEHFGRLPEPNWGQPQLVHSDDGSAYVKLDWVIPVLDPTPGSAARRLFKVQLQRTVAARSRTPDENTLLGCPACLQDLTLEGTSCALCEVHITHGQRDWQIRSIERFGQAPLLGAMALGRTGPVHASAECFIQSDPELDAQLRGLTTRYPTLSTTHLERQAAKAWLTWCTAVSAGQPQLIKGVMTESLKRDVALVVRGLRACDHSVVLDAPRVLQVDWIRAEQDGWHERVELRLSVELGWRVTDRQGVLVDGHATERVTYACDALMVHATQPGGGEPAFRLAALKVVEVGP